MARLAAVLKASATATWRERRSLFSFGANNFFVTVVFFFREYLVGVLFYSLLAAILLFPLSTDPIQKIPRERLSMWPLSRADRWLLRMAAPWLNPLTWILTAFIIWFASHRAIHIAFLAVGLLVAVSLVGALVPQGGRGGFWRWVPGFPTVVGQLVRKDLRQLLSTLDFWLAAVLSGSFALSTLLLGTLPEEAYVTFSLLVVLALSTVAQTLFASDGAAGITRYRLLPIRGWQVLAAKTAAFLSVVCVLTAPLSIPVGITAASVVLAYGYWASVHRPSIRRHWRFSSSPAAWNSVGLVLTLLAAGVAVLRASAWFLAAALLAAFVSLLAQGRHFDKCTLSL
jgi:hypothetical protein